MAHHNYYRRRSREGEIGMNHMASRLFKLRGIGLSASAALLGTLFACSGDDNSKPPAVDGDASCATSTTTVTATATGSTSGSTSKSTSTSSATSVADAATDAPVTDSAPDQSTSDAPVGPPPALNICAQLDSIYSITASERGNPWAWPAVITSGFPTKDRTGADADIHTGFDGFENLVADDCRIANFFNDGGNGLQWADNVQAWEQRIFGCPVVSDAGGLPGGFGFALVPPQDFGVDGGVPQQLTRADLKRLGDTFVEAVIEAVTTQVTDPANTNVPLDSPLLTTEQIDGIQAWVAYEETLYPSIDTSATTDTTFSHSTCP
jgi:hypothetical protein